MQVVPALLEDHHRPAGCGQHVGGRRPSGPGPHDDGVDGHASETSCVGPSPGLDVAGEPDVRPSDAVPVAPVLRRAVHALAGVPVDELGEVRVGVEPAVLFLALAVGEVGSERGEAGAVPLLEAHHRSVEFALGPAERALDPGTPGQFVEGGQRMEGGEVRRPAEPARGGPAGPDPRWIERERPQQAVDVVDHSRVCRTRSVVGRNESLAHRRQCSVLVLGQPGGHCQGKLTEPDERGLG